MRAGTGFEVADDWLKIIHISGNEMTKVSAFVAHSFREDDQDHVNKFLGFLDHLSDTSPSFSWDHALGAKPQDLREKVLEKIEGKNLLIAICSRHTFSISPGDLKPTLFGSKFTIPNADRLVWRTSEWIVQEIGLAFGRGMKLLLLVEEGIKSPGGLQGNIEYIEFSRSSPELSFIRLMEMVNALTNNQSSEAKGVSPVSEAPSTQEEEVKPEVVKVDVAPDPAMSVEDLERGWFMAVIRKNLELEDQYLQAFLQSPHAATVLQRDQRAAKEEWLRQIANEDGNLEKVRKLRAKWPDDPSIANSEARLLEQMQEYSAAAESFLVAANKTEEVSVKVKSFTEAAKAFARTKQFERVEHVLKEARKVISESGSDELLRTFLQDFPLVYEEREKMTKIASLEALLEMEPNDFSARFDLAYLYGELDMNEMAFYHYWKVPSIHRSNAVWNNIGVASGLLKLKGESVVSYKKAAEGGNSLASSNHARLQRDAGFYEEAEAACRAALKLEGCDPQVGETLSSISDVRTQESRAATEIRERAEAISSFMRPLGRACASNMANINGEWISPLCTLTLIDTNGEVAMSGSYNAPRGLSRLMAGETGKEKKITRKFTGKRYGNAVIGTVAEEQDESSILTALGGAMGSEKFYLFLDESSGSIRVLEFKDGTNKPSDYVISRKAT